MSKTRVEVIATGGTSYAVEVARCGRMSVEELRVELARGLTLTAEHLIRLSAVWSELEGRGEDLSDLRHGLARCLPLIASGRLAAEAVVAFSGRPAVVRALEGVPLDKQRRLAAGEPIEVIDPATAEGTSLMPLDRLPAAALRLVFADGEVREPAAQRLALRPRQPRSRNESRKNRFQPQVDRESGVVRIGRMEVRLDDMLAALASSAGPELPALLHPEEYVSVKTRLSREEQRKLTAAAVKADLPDWEMIRKALRAMGMI